MGASSSKSEFQGRVPWLRRAAQRFSPFVVLGSDVLCETPLGGPDVQVNPEVHVVHRTATAGAHIIESHRPRRGLPAEVDRRRSQADQYQMMRTLFTAVPDMTSQDVVPQRFPQPPMCATYHVSLA